MPKATAAGVKYALAGHASSERKKANEWFFKTGPGQYGEGDAFVGVSMPDNRKVAKHYVQLPFDEVAKLLASPIHEHRMCGLLILTYRYGNAEKVAYAHGRDAMLPVWRGGGSVGGVVPPGRGRYTDQRDIVRFYVAHIDRVNNWDLVDCSAPQILGRHYRTFGGEEQLYTLAKSRSLWRRRIAIVSTYAFIQAGRCAHTLAIAEMLRDDREDLIHKATGWMLREVGKRDKAVLVSFLERHAPYMPRTCLRYAIERFPEEERRGWLAADSALAKSSAVHHRR